MKIEMQQNKTYLFANKPSQDVIVSLDLDTQVENNDEFKGEKIHYCFLLDISNSKKEQLEGNGIKKDRIRTIMKSFVKDTVPKFREEDIISLVVYDTKPQLVFQGCGKNDKVKMLEGINKILSQDMFNEYNKLSDVLNQCIGLINFYKENNGFNKNKMIVITDTKPSFCRDEFGSIVDTEEDVIKASKNVASNNISLDCICIGSLNDEEKGDYEFAEKLVQASNGKAYTIEDTELIKLHLADSISDSCNSSRYNGKLILLFNEGVTARDCYSISPVNKYFGKIEIQQPNENIPYRHCVLELPELKDDTTYNFMLDISVPTILTSEEKQNPNWRGYKPFVSVIAKVTYETFKNGQIVKVEDSNRIISHITHDELADGREYRGNLEKYYKLATIKRHESDFIKANKTKNLKVLVESGNIMSEIYEELGMYEESSMIRRFVQKFQETNELNATEINTMVKKSSTARVGSTRTIEVPEEFEGIMEN